MISLTIKENLTYAVKLLKDNQIEESVLKAKLLLSYVLKKPKEYLIINEKKELLIEEQKKFEDLLLKLSNNIPLQYLTNKQEFYGIEFFVNENVLIPQPDTEILVEEVIEISRKENLKEILDLCTGSGAIAVVLSENLKSATITASDISEKALEIAKINDKKHKVIFKQSDMFENLHNQKFDIIVSNPPYIKTDIIRDLNKEVQHEPKLALDGGQDGLNFYRIIINEASEYLNENGYLCLEIGDDQKTEIIKMLKDKNYKNIYSKKDFAGNDRVVIGMWEKCKKL